MPEPYYPPAAFHFTVTILGAGAAAAALTGADASFQEVSGMQAEQLVEEVAEGGENRFVHRLPTRGKHTNLVLKRGIVTGSSYFNAWVRQSIGATLVERVVTHDLQVTLLDASSDPLVVWSFVNAYPVKCDVGPLDAMANAVLIETLELSYNYFTRETPGARRRAAA